MSLKLMMGDVDLAEPSLQRTAAFRKLRDRKEGLNAHEVNELLDLFEDSTDDLTSPADVYNLTNERNDLAEQLREVEETLATEQSINANTSDRVALCEKSLKSALAALDSNAKKSQVRALIEQAMKRLQP